MHQHCSERARAVSGVRPRPSTLIINRGQRPIMHSAPAHQIRNYFRPLATNFIINYTLKFHSAVSELCLDNRSLWSQSGLLPATAAAIKVFMLANVNVPDALMSRRLNKGKTKRFYVALISLALHATF